MYDGHSEVPRCSFCGKTQEEVEVLIANPSDNRAFICNECVAVCHSVLEEYHKEKETNEEARLARLKAFAARR